jgi:hypothetical protein
MRGASQPFSDLSWVQTASQTGAEYGSLAYFVGRADVSDYGFHMRFRFEIDYKRCIARFRTTNIAARNYDIRHC